ncbi:MAG: glycerophosphodiester phosphodiesterase [Nitriliruptorales bacterium]
MPGSTRRSRPLVVAHRGASTEAPEHTRAAYDAAVAAGADAVEVDVRLSRDGVLVCVHDADLERVAGRRGRVDELTLDELRGLDIGSWFNRARPDRARDVYARERIVTLEEELAHVDEADVGIVVELKEPDLTGGRMEAALVELLGRRDLLAAPRGRLVVETFDRGALVRLHRRAPEIALGLLWFDEADAGLADTPPDWLEVSGPNLYALFASDGHVERMHASGRTVYVWTADDEEEVAALVELGVDAIVTNRPRAVVTQMTRQGFGGLE